MRAGATRRSAGRALPGRESSWPALRDPLGDARALVAGDAGAAARLQRSIGNAGVGRLLTLARCGAGSGAACGCCGDGAAHDGQLADEQADTLTSAVVARRQLARQPAPPPWEDNQPPKTGPDPGKQPEVTGCNLIFKWETGRWYWNCEGIPGIGSTPDIPVDPRHIPDEIDRKLPKDDKKKLPGPLPDWPRGPGGGSVLPPRWWEDLCKRDPLSPLCLGVPPAPKPGTPAPTGRPVGMFWSNDVTFERDLPAASGAKKTGMTQDGVATLASVVSLLESDPTLQVRLVGHASSEGTDTDNLALSQRRAKAVQAELQAKGLGARIMDLVGGSDPDGCSKVEFGVWACGESKAAQDAVKPEDRKVMLTLLRNAPVTWPLPTLKVTPPFGP